MESMPTAAILASYDILLRRVHLLELADGSLQSVLHHVAEVKVGLSDLVVGHHEHRLDVLQGESVALDSLKGLGPADKGLDVFRIDLQDSSAIGNDAVKVGDLFVARCVSVCGNVWDE